MLEDLNTHIDSKRFIHSEQMIRTFQCFLQKKIIQNFIIIIKLPTTHISKLRILKVVKYYTKDI